MRKKITRGETDEKEMIFRERSKKIKGQTLVSGTVAKVKTSNQELTVQKEKQKGYKEDLRTRKQSRLGGLLLGVWL